MRLKNLILIDQVINGNTTVESDPKLNDALGEGDTYTVQTYVANSGGTSPTITVKMQGSNDGKSWADRQTILNAQDISTSPYENITESTADMVVTAQGKLQVNLGGTNPYAYVRIVACTRSS